MKNISVINMLAAALIGTAAVCSCKKDEAAAVLSVDAPSDITFAADGTCPYSTIRVSGSTEWKVALEPADGAGWLKIGSRTDRSFTLVAEPNPYASHPDAVTVRVSADDTAGTTVTARQLAGPVMLRLVPEADEIVFAADGTVRMPEGETPVTKPRYAVETVFSDWKVDMEPSDGAGWLSVVRDASAEAFCLTARPNPYLFAPEQVTVTVSAGGGAAFSVIRVSQEASSAQGPAVNIALAGIADGKEFTVTFLNGIRRAGVVSAGTLSVRGVETTDDIIYGIESEDTGEILLGRRQTENIELAFEKNRLVFRSGSDGARLINSYAELAMVGTDTGAPTVAYRQESDLDLLGDQRLAGRPGIVRQSWKPIGDLSRRFEGSYEGGGFALDNLYIETDKDNIGLFGCIGQQGEVKEVILNSGTIEGRTYCGGICGLGFGRITDCINRASVSGNDHVGGICGNNAVPGRIEGCLNAGVVGGNAATGGICGYNYSRVSESVNEGSVAGTAGSVSIGGICGFNNGSALIYGCHNRGEVSGLSAAGGICGTNYGRDGSAAVTCSSNEGAVSGVHVPDKPSSDIGGICGHNNHALVEACVNRGPVEGDEYVGGVGGYNYGRITASYNTGLVKGGVYLGGVCGYIGSDEGDPSTLTACYNTGEVSGALELGSVCGPSWGVITGCY